MSEAVRARWDGYVIKLPFTEEELARFRAYLVREDKKAGRFVRTLVLRELDRAEGKGEDAGRIAAEPVRLELGGE